MLAFDLDPWSFHASVLYRRFLPSILFPWLRSTSTALNLRALTSIVLLANGSATSAWRWRGNIWPTAAQLHLTDGDEACPMAARSRMAKVLSLPARNWISSINKNIRINERARSGI